MVRRKKRIILGFIAVLVMYNVPCAALKVYVTSVPKCGTHLLLRTLYFLTGFEVKWIHFPTRNDAEDKVLVNHMTFSKTSFLLKRKDCKGFFIYRDPRDMVVAYAFARLHVYKNLTLDEIILKLIEESIYTHVVLARARGIKAVYDLFLPWKNYSQFYTVRFEDLVGPQGGGSKEIQYETIKNMAQYLKIEVTDEQIDEIANEVFGGSVPGSLNTFRTGQIGSWKNYFNEQHKEAFKKIAGQLLIDLGYEKDLDW